MVTFGNRSFKVVIRLKWGPRMDTNLIILVSYKEGLPWSLSCTAGDPGAIPGSGRSSGEGKGYPLQYSNWVTFTSLIRRVKHSPWDQTRVSSTAGRVFTIWATQSDPWVRKLPYKRESLQYSCLEKSMDRGAWQTTDTFTFTKGKPCEYIVRRQHPQVKEKGLRRNNPIDTLN